MNNPVFRTLEEGEICRELFLNFHRRQKVVTCLRKEGDCWVDKEAPFIDDWSESDYAYLIDCLRRTVRTGGAVFGAFVGEKLKGFVSVESTPLGKRGSYRDMTSLHVSEELRRSGIGSQLFLLAKTWARSQGAEKLYISSHSASESQAFYKAMGCTDAEEINEEHAQKEPYDRQLECLL